MNNDVIISPSILSADFSDLKSVVKDLNQTDCEWIHFDVMDGHFVPNLTFGPSVIKSLRKYSKKIFDVHLMMDNPIDYLDEFVEAGSDYISIHVESLQVKQLGLTRCIELIKSKGVKVGIVIQPDTSVASIIEYVNLCDLVLVMGVYAGFGGQTFIPSTLTKIKKLKKYANENVLISVDGGINKDTASDVKAAGVDVMIAGSYIFGGKHEYRIKMLRK